MVMKRKKIRLKYKKARVLLSDTLPYELPFIFTNRYFYRFVVKNKVELNGHELSWDENISDKAKAVLSFIFRKNVSNSKNNKIKFEDWEFKTIPFQYSILHKENKNRRLSIIHPANQVQVIDFYNKYKDMILYLCSKSHFSMRYPNKVASFFYYRDRLHKVLLGKKTDKIEIFFSEYENLKTFFSYKKYTNIYKFYEDYTYQRAEKKFQYLLKFDIQSCFDSIYTHSISWAISGGANLYKDNFDGKSDSSVGFVWDKLMQGMNYNETNGILIGPEFSRLFTEVILQHIDQRVENDLFHDGFKSKVDYECYRYMDDFFFFYNDSKVKEKAVGLFEEYLKEFKLCISSEKTALFERPFITNITEAKLKIDTLLDEVVQLYVDNSATFMEDDDISDEKPTGDEEDEKMDINRLKEYLSKNIYFKYKSTLVNKRFKAIQKDCNVKSKDILNYTMARLTIKVERVLKKFDQSYKFLSFALKKDECCSNLHNEIQDKLQKLEHKLSYFLAEIIDSAFFMYASNKRINTTLKVIQLLNNIIIYLENNYIIEGEEYKRFGNDIREHVFKKIQDEVNLVIQTAPVNENTQLETLYFLIIMRQLNAKYQITPQRLECYLGVERNGSGTIEKFPHLNAISDIILLYYFKNNKRYKELKEALLNTILQNLEKIPQKRRNISAEFVILGLDIAACPFVMKSWKVKMLQKIGCSRRQGDQIVKYMITQKFMFTKWTAVDITKELNAKISQEVYS